MSSLKRRLVGRVDRYARRVADETAAQMTGHLERVLRTEMQELARMLRQQGDAADEVAETFGRTLARLSGEIESLDAVLRDLQGGQGRVSPPAPGP